MQVARMQSGRHRGFISKLQEAAEAWVLTADFGHDALLRHYLTLAPYGARVHGASRAARFYFDKPVDDLSWLQAAWLAGLPQQPTKMGPFTEAGRKRGLARAHRILRALHGRGYLDDHDLDVALASDLGLVDKRPRPESAIHYSLIIANDVRAARLKQPGLTLVHSSLDLEVQEPALAIMRIRFNMSSRCSSPLRERLGMRAEVGVGGVERPGTSPTWRDATSEHSSPPSKRPHSEAVSGRTPRVT
jgi:penicillin-binding protein 1C